MPEAPERSHAAAILLRNADVYAPAPLGIRDVLIVGERVAAIGSDLSTGSLDAEILDLGGARLIPGLVDAHVHLTGGGGEAGFSSRVPRRALTDLSSAGVTSVVGVLGTDGSTRSVRDLVACCYALREEGLSAWCWSGSYEVPVRTLTGRVRDDIVFIDPIIGVGELAISDHRGSQPTLDEILRIASDCHVAGMIAGKAGVLHLHLGDGSRGLGMIDAALKSSELPARVFHPTHLNRNRRLFAEGLAWLGTRASPTIDLTAFPPDDVGDGLSAADALLEIDAAGHGFERVTVSSDGGGCLPEFDGEGRINRYGVGSSATLLPTLMAVVAGGVNLADALAPFTTNVAVLLRLPRKGRVAVGADADLLVLDASGRCAQVLARGRFMVRDGVAVIRGTFETA